MRALYPDASAFTERTGTGPARPAQLRGVLRDVRRAGFAREDGEVTDGFRSVAAAIQNAAGWPVAAVAELQRRVRGRPLSDRRLMGANRGATLEGCSRLSPDSPSWDSRSPWGTSSAGSTSSAPAHVMCWAA
ncbi:hypothetical protein GCM10027408_32810 [Microbacterium tumbae]